MPTGNAHDGAKIEQLFSTPAKVWWNSAEAPSLRVLKITPDDAEFRDAPGSVASHVKMNATAGTRSDLGNNRKVVM